MRSAQSILSLRVLWFTCVFLVSGGENCVADFPDTPIILDSQSTGCASSSEICGDGIDQDCNGDDALCSAPDSDRDGFGTGADCDDTTRRIYPNVYVSCSSNCGTGTKKCQDNGAYSSCSCTPLCEATTGRKCYYISKMTGDDLNDGTFEKPWASAKNIVSFNCANGCPTKWTQLLPGDVVYFMSGVYDDVFDLPNESNRSLFFSGINGEASRPIVLKAYPGAHPVIASASESISALHIRGSSYFVVDGFEITKAFSRGVSILESHDIELKNIWVHDITEGSVSDVSGILSDASQNIYIHHSIINDNYNRSNKSEDSQNIALFSGGNIRILRNIIFQSLPITSSSTGGCIAYKHASTVSGANFEVGYNMLWNCAMTSIASSTDNTKIHRNLVLNSDAVSFEDFGGRTVHQNNIVEYNTIVGSKALRYEPTNAWSSIGLTTFRNNIVYDTTAYDSLSGCISIGTGGSSELFNLVVDGGKLSFSSNCYYNPNRPIKFNLFSTNSEVGGIYGFASWQNLGFDF